MHSPSLEGLLLMPVEYMVSMELLELKVVQGSLVFRDIMVVAPVGVEDSEDQGVLEDLVLMLLEV